MRRSSRPHLHALAVAVATMLSVCAGQVRAATLECACTGLDAAFVYSLEHQVCLSVRAGDPDEVVFRFENLGPERSSIYRIYFEDADDLLTGIVDLDGSSDDVSFSVGGTPPFRPGGRGGGFPTAFYATADAPRMANGIGSGEWLDGTLGLRNGVDADELFDAVESFELRAGIEAMHLQGPGNHDGAIIPEPGSGAAMTLALLALTTLRRPTRRQPGDNLTS